jgi:tetratricopeptide (TPR) repeat protein
VRVNKTPWIKQVRRSLRRQAALLGLVALVLLSIGFPIAAQPPATPSVQQLAPAHGHTLDQQARQHYEAAQYADAVTLWQQAIAAYRANPTGQAQTWSNLSLAYQHLGQWEEASRAIANSLTLIQNPNSYIQNPNLLLAQALDVQGQLQLRQGNPEAALSTWRQAATHYTNLNDQSRLTRNQINQAQALQSLGFYPESQKQLLQMTQQLQPQPDSALKAISLRSLGNTLRLTGNLTESRRVLQQSLAIATQLANSPAIGEALLSLGHTAAAQGNTAEAIAFYQQAAIQDALTAIPAQLHQLNLLIETGQLQAARSLLPRLQTQLETLPPSRISIYARIEYAQSLIQLGADNRMVTDVLQRSVNAPASPFVAQQLTIALQQARQLQDARAESYAIGILGHLYEQTRQWPEATRLTRQALQMAQTLDAADIAYQWQWQVGCCGNRGM